MYSLLVYTHPYTPTSKTYFNELLKTDSLDWLCLLPCLVTLNSYSCSFQYEILNNVLYLNKKLFTFWKSNSPLCPFCKISDKTVLHLLYECDIVQNLWNERYLFFKNDFTLFDLTLQAAFLDFLNVDSKLLLIQNHLLLIFKIYIYNSKRYKSLIIKFLIREIMKVRGNIKHIGKKFNNHEKNLLRTRENSSSLKMFWKPKLFDILSDLI